MSLIETDTERQDRMSALDAFAAAPRQDVVAAHDVFPSGGMLEQRVVGAQQVAVRRDTAQVLKNLAALAAAAGEDWYYRFPVRSGNKQTFIEGPSIKLANDLARMYGNCEVDTRVQDAGEHWIIYARFTDIETGFAMTRPFQQRKNQGSVRGDADRARDIAFQIGVSKAIRNVVVNSLQTFADYAFDGAKNSLVERIGKSLPAWKERLLQRLSENEIDVKRVEAVVGRTSDAWLAPDIARIVAMVKAIQDGMATKDETFPPLTQIDGKAEGSQVSGFAGDVLGKVKAQAQKWMDEADWIIDHTGKVIKGSGPVYDPINGDKVVHLDANGDIGQNGIYGDAPDEAATGNATEAAPTEQAEMGFPGDKPPPDTKPKPELTAEQIEACNAAYALGKEARGKGRPITTLPKEMRDDPKRAHEAEAWKRGHLEGGITGGTMRVQKSD